MRRGILFAVTVLLASTGCVGGERAPSPTATRPTTTTVPPTTAPPVPADVALPAFEDCLADHGLITEAVPLDAIGRPRLDWFLRGLDLTATDTISALTACASILGTGGLDLTDEPEIKEAVLASLHEFSECVRSRGVPDFPDPVPGFSGFGAPYPPAEIPYSDPDLAQAVAACRERIPMP